MYIYKYGAIGETIRAKIDSYKQEVRGGEGSSDSFGDVLKTYLYNTSKETKVVSALGNNSIYSDSATQQVQNLNGSTLLYAMQNLDEDSMASTVLSGLGFTANGNSATALKTAADELSASAELLVKANGSGGDTTLSATEFVSAFNKLMTALSSEGTSSSYLYKTALGAAATASSEGLSAAGVTYKNGQLSYDGNGGNIPDNFINAVASSAGIVSSYAASIVAEDTDDSGASEYYTTLMNSMI